MKQGKRYYGGVSDIVNFIHNFPVPNVIICLWGDKDSYPSIIGGRANCKHVYVEKQHCKNCGAFVGNIGQEYEIEDAYSHIHWLVNNLYRYVDRVVFKTDFAIPTEHRHKLTRQPYLYSTVTSHLLYNKVIPQSSLQSGYSQNRYITVFQKGGLRNILTTPTLYCAELCVYDILLDHCIIVNPDVAELKRSYQKNYLICHNKTVKLLA